VSDGSKSISIKVIDNANSRILHSCDFAITFEYKDNRGKLNQQILIHDTTTNRYYWNDKPSRTDYTEKLSNIKENGIWGELREVYLHLKNNNHDEGKKSFTLFHEAINNVYNQYEWV
jgi:hypothetical protein